MSLLHRFRYARGLSFPTAAAKALRLGRRTIAGRWKQTLRGNQCTYEKAEAAGAPRSTGYVPEIPPTLLIYSMESIIAVCGNYLEHRFDLLGSGWVRVECADADAEQLVSALSSGNRARARQIRKLIGPAYRPIDWQIDFKSGYRWSESQWHETIQYGHQPGVDIKVPWELARLQHLPQLALAHILTSDPIYRDEFCNQALDFLAANPPGFGVNWACAMDVAIRAANLAMAMDLFTRHGADFSDDFRSEFSAGILSHGRFVAANLEWGGEVRANHFLADIVGLLFIAAYLESSPEIDGWLAFAVSQLVIEVKRQFTADGAGFEASTGYHRLSAEMAAYGSALVLGLSNNKRKMPVEMYPVPGDKEGRSSPFPAWYFKRLERMAEFIMHVTKPNRQAAQIGDMDNGRFFKLCPLFGRGLDEKHLDHRATVAAINGLFSRGDLSAFAGAAAEVESAMTAGLSGWTKAASYLGEGGSPAALSFRVKGRAEPALKGREIVIELAAPDVLYGLETAAYPDFGLYIWRSQRFFLSVRCGPVGQEGNGGHAHNDQLAIELNIDGEDWLADPGSYVYTPSPEKRNAYRSALAHAGPRLGDREPSRLDQGMFRLEDSCRAKCLRFDEAGFHGIHHGFGAPVHRSVTIEKNRVIIRDSMDGERRVVSDAKSLRELFPCSVAFSPGYGRVS
ncbi:MAG: hypothetical protein A3G18_08020 [Rhodospirillales bacterium RIFCSPLOWO2_12_FULL_58_28]|nr:MAG: hypothetical protein A3G18_08020 [Rhodospirillales bacterium RIFCSPLOWO2_12_FULL_58_28]